MSPDSRKPQSIPITFTGSLALDDPHSVEEAIRRGIRQAVREFEYEHPTVDPPATRASGVVPRERVFHVFGDILRVGATAQSPVLSLGRDLPLWVKAGGYVEVETDNPARAVNWGNRLFGARGFAVLAKPHERGRLLVRPLVKALHVNDFGGFAPAVSREPGRVGTVSSAPASGATFLTDPENNPLIISTAEGVRLYRTNVSDSPTAWVGDNIERWLADPVNAASLAESDVSAVVQLLTTEHADDLGIAHILAALDRSLFAAMALDDRRRYLLVLMRLAEQPVSGVDTDQLDAAMVELVASCRSKSELDALLAPLAADGTLLKLFSQFDKPTFRLLIAVGSHLAITPLEPAQLLDIVVYQLKHPMSMIDIAEFVGTAYDWLRGTVASLGDLPLLPVELASGVPKLFELYLLVSRALGEMPIPIPGFPAVPLPPDPAAQAQLRALLASAGTTARTAMLGLQHIDQLAGTGAVASALARRITRVVMLEILAAFVTGLPEAKAAAVAEKIAAQARLFEALATALQLADAGEVGRLMWLLPKSYSDDVLRLLTNAPSRAKTLPRFLATSPQARAAGKRLTAGLRVAEVVEDAVGPASGLAEDVLAGVHRMLDLVDAAPGWSGDAMRALLKGIPGQEMSAMLRVAGRLTTEQLRDLGPTAFNQVARARGALEFVVDAGGHALAPTARAFGTYPARYEHFLEKVADARQGLGPQQYHHLMERIAAGDLADFDDADFLSRITEAAAKAVRPTSGPTVPASSLGKIGRIASKEAFRREVARILRENPAHPLRVLLDENGNLRTTIGDAAHWFEHPEISEAGHLRSAKSLTEAGSDQLVVMSAYRNRLASSTIEHPSKGGFMSIEAALDIEGIPIDIETAVDLVAKGSLDPAVVARAPRISYRLAAEAPFGSAADAAAKGLRVAAEPPRLRVEVEQPRIRVADELVDEPPGIADELVDELEPPAVKQMIKKEPEQ